MFISRSKLEYMEEALKYLEQRIDEERSKRWQLEGRLYRLMGHLGLTEETRPEITEIVKVK